MCIILQGIFQFLKIRHRKVVWWSTECFFSDGVTEKAHRPTKSHFRSQSNLFKIAHDEAIKQICLKIQAKLDEFFELEEYNWLLSEPSGHASNYITDSIAFLHGTFESFIYFPVFFAFKRKCAKIIDQLENIYIF